MHRETIGERLQKAMKARDLYPAKLALLSGTTKETIGNYMHDRVSPDHVKAVQLFRIANAVGLTGYELLTGESEPISHGCVAAEPAPYPSHPVQLNEWKIAFQLVAEVLDDRGLSLPPGKRAEVTLLAHDLLVDGMQQARVLQLVRAAAA